MKIMITGGRGMLGRTLFREFCGHDLAVADLPECDITATAGLNAFFAETRPDVVIHCAAMTQVDLCETEAERAYKLNAVGTGNVAAACFRYNARLIAISTDYVFSGDLDRPYNEFDPAGARTVYGASKFAGEQLVRELCPNHVIARISWLYGPGGPSFVHTMMKLADGTRDELKVVSDQVGNPTSTLAVARKLHEIVDRPELGGTFHLTCEGEASWFEFASTIFRLAGICQKVVPCATAEYPRPAPRPANSRLDKMMLRMQGLSPMPDWKSALAEFMAEEF
ncbi:MAG: dTDP-4-dehydrorhamnose reductase [Victivallaceae bacterium]|nr:dTDP-4-dehydrorhamnose reductase [Victivallaceae bacterium]